MRMALATSLLHWAGTGLAREADNVLPADAWRATAPSTGKAPPTPFQSLVGLYRSPGQALLALDAWARSHHPADDPRVFSTGLVEVDEGQSFDFRRDSNGDGVVDTHLYSQPLDAFGAMPRNCSRGDGARDPTGAAFGTQTALAYEPEDAVTAAQGPLIRGLCVSVYCQRITGCDAPRGQPNFARVVLPLHKTSLAVSSVCEVGWRPATEDLSGRLTSTMTSCEHLGGLDPEANLGGECPALANGSNPVNTTTGNKYQRELDYGGTVHGDLAFSRHYNSQQRRGQDLGPGWSHDYSAELHLVTHRTGAQTARLYRPDGRVLRFNRAAGSAAFVPISPLTVGILRAPAGSAALEYVDGEDRVERYDLPRTLVTANATSRDYLLVGRDDPRRGRREVLHYDARRLLLRVEGRFGRALSFEHDARGRLVAMVDAGGHRHRYAYDSLDRLVAAIAPDDNDVATDPASFADNPRRGYRYTDSDWPQGLTELVDERGNVYARWDYDASGRALSSEHAGGVERVSFDFQPAYTAVTDARGATRSYNTRAEFGVGLITAVSGGNCNFCGAGPLAATTYDARGHRDLVTDHLGNVVDYDHDARGLETRRAEGQGENRRVTVTDWLPTLRLPLRETLSDGAGSALRSVDYDYRGARLASRAVTDLVAGGGTRTTRYRWYGDDDAADPRVGLLAEVDGPRSDVADVTRYEHDRQTGNLLAITNALGHVTRFTAHDAEGRPLVMLDANGVETRFEYDARGRLIARSIAGARTSYRYDARGLLVEERQPDGSRLDYGYDAAQRLVRIDDTLGNHQQYTLDALGNRIAETTHDPAGTLSRSLARAYDQRNQLLTVTGGEGQVQDYGYDANGALESIGDPRGVALPRRLARDSLLRVVTDTDGAGGVTRYAYDAFDGIASVTDPRGLVTRYTRNAFGEALVTTSPDAGVSEDGYDEAGNRIRHLQRQSGTQTVPTRYRYDALNRRVAVDYPTDTDLGYSYDDATPGRNAVGRLSAMTDASGTTLFDYDARGNLVRRRLQGPGGQHEIAYRYDDASRVAAIDYPSGLRLALSRDAAGRTTELRAEIGATSIALASGITWQPFGGVTGLTLGNGLRETREYDRAGRLTAIRNASTALPSYRYARYDAADNLLEVSTEGGASAGLGGTRQYRYDALQRLVFESDGTGAFSYAYDANGNRTLRDEQRADGSLLRRVLYRVGATSNRVYGAQARGDDYDLAGNLLRHHTGYALVNGVASNIGPDLGITYRYDESGRPATVMQQVAVRWTARYDGQGRRALRYVGGDLSQPTVYLYAESGELLAAISSSGGRPTTWREYVWLEGRPLAEITTPAGGVPRIRYLHVNQVNQLQYMTDTRGRMTMSSTGGDAFGFGGQNDLDVDRDGVSEAPAILRGFPGQVNDGPVFGNGYRDYVAGLGRYLEPDPLGLTAGTNVYTYVGANPLRYVDSLGLTQCDVDTAIDFAESHLRGRKLPAPASGVWQAPQNVEIVSDSDIDRLGRHGITGNPPSAASRRLGDTWVDTLLHPRYAKCLSDEEARDLLDTIIHEGAHWGAPADAPYQFDSASATGFAYVAAKEFGTQSLMNAYVRERQKCRCLCGI
ncbi:MAG: hypothetical protein K2Y51_17080 [Gammaproteobacteria bacterium]|nr:hypothetical protein [Gammaproteobacteria bacterium]